MRSEASGPHDPPANKSSDRPPQLAGPQGRNPSFQAVLGEDYFPNWSVLPTVLDDGTPVYILAGLQAQNCRFVANVHAIAAPIKRDLRLPEFILKRIV
jgi:hypothetical protein